MSHALTGTCRHCKVKIYAVVRSYERGVIEWFHVTRFRFCRPEHQHVAEPMA